MKISFKDGDVLKERSGALILATSEWPETTRIARMPLFFGRSGRVTAFRVTVGRALRSACLCCRP